MKFRIASLLSLLSGMAFINSPSLSMTFEEKAPSYVPSKPKEVLTVEQNSFEELIRVKSVVSSYVYVRKLGNAASAEELIGFLFGEAWQEISSEHKSWIVSRITSEVKRLELDGLEKLIRKNNVPNTYLFLRKSGNQASKEDLVGHILRESWEGISTENQSWVVARVISEAQRLELEVLLGQQDYVRAYRSIKSFGNKGSDEGTVRLCLKAMDMGTGISSQLTIEHGLLLK